MKKFLVFLCACFAVSCMAAFQYGANIEQENEYVSAGLNKDTGWTITAKQNVVLQMNTDLDALAGVNRHMNTVIGNLLDGSFAPTNTELGYMVYDSATNSILSVSSLSFENNLATIQLQAGSTIGFWLTAGGINYSSIRGVDGYTYNMSLFGGGDNGNGNKVYNFGNGWYKDESGISYGYEQSMLFGVAPDSAAPAGQPLPGILATVALGGAVVGLIRRRNRKVD